MSDYQAIYDAVRSRIHGCNIGEVIREAAMSAFDISCQIPVIAQEFIIAGQEMQRPSVLFKPRISQDGDQWMALLGDNLAEGVAGFGKTPDEAMRAFDQAFYKQITDPTLVERVP